MLLEGQHIDRYHLLRLIGNGGMGAVYLAEDARIGQQVAIKVIHTEASADAMREKEVIHLFHREAKAVAMLDHPHILPLYDYGEEHLTSTTYIYMVTPYRPEGSLLDWLRRRSLQQRFSPQEVAHLVSQAAGALQHAHDRQIIHQDVKPSNFLIRSNKENPAYPDILLADFGIARLATATSRVSQSIRGTPTYMAPEQWQGQAVPATDQYGLAVMTYELLTGHTPFQGNFGQMMYQHLTVQPALPSTLNPRLSKEVDSVLLTALAKDPTRRFASVTAFAQALSQAVQPLRRTDPSISRALLNMSGNGITNAEEQEDNTRIINTGNNQQVLISSSDLRSMPPPGVPTPAKEVSPTPVLSAFNTPFPIRQLPETPIPTAAIPLLPRRRISKRMFALLALVLLLLVPLSSLAILPLLRGQSHSPPPQNPLAQPLTSIGVVKAPTNEYIGVSDGTFAFDTNRPDGDLKRQAADKMKAGDASGANYLWQQAVAKDTNDAEALIYLEDMRVRQTGSPLLTVVIGTTLTGGASAVATAQANLRGAYVAQKEYNSQQKLPNGVQVSLLIANSGSNQAYATFVAKQIAQIARTDKTIVGVMGWTLDAQLLNALAVLAPAHIPMVANAGNDELTGKSSYAFRVVSNGVRNGTIGAQVLEKTLHARTVALFTDPQDDQSRGVARGFTQTFTGDGKTIVATEHFTVGKTQNMPRLLQDALSKHPDAIYFAGRAQDASPLLALLQPTDPPVMGPSSLYNLQGYSQAARAGLSHLHITAGAYPDEWDALGLAAQKPPFFADFKAAFDPQSQKLATPYGYDRADGPDILSYDSMSVLLYASNIALTKGPLPGIDQPGTVLWQVLHEVTGQKAFQGVSGVISFGPDGGAINKPLAILCVDKDKHFKLDAVLGQFQVGGPPLTHFPTTSVCA